MPDENGNPTPEEIEQALAAMDQATLAGMTSTNNLGQGPGYMGFEDNPFSRPGQKADYMNKILRWAQDNSYLDPLLGIAPAPEAPSGERPTLPQAPDLFQSDVRSVYGSNPVLADAFALIDAGQDPVTVMNGLQQLWDDGDQAVRDAFTYKDTNGMVATDKFDRNTVNQILTDVATDKVRMDRENPQAMSQYEQALQDVMQEQENWDAQQLKFDAYNNPMDEYSLRGSPTVDQDIEDVLMAYGKQRAQGPTELPTGQGMNQTTETFNRMQDTVGGIKDLFGGLQRGPAPDLPGKGSGPMYSTGPSPLGAAVEQYNALPGRRQQLPGVPESKIDYGMWPKGPLQAPTATQVRQAMPSKPLAAPVRSVRIEKRGPGELSAIEQGILKGRVAASQAKQKENVRPAGQQYDNQKRLEMAYRIIMGENPQF